MKKSFYTLNHKEIKKFNIKTMLYVFTNLLCVGKNPSYIICFDKLSSKKRNEFGFMLQK